jgi:hypothetical protein
MAVLGVLRAFDRSVLARGDGDKCFESMHVVVWLLRIVRGESRIVASLQSVRLLWLILHVRLRTKVSRGSRFSTLVAKTNLLLIGQNSTCRI